MISIPSAWWRHLVFFIAVLEIAGGCLWAAGKVAPAGTPDAWVPLFGLVLFLASVFIGAPLLLRILAPNPSNDTQRKDRLTAAALSAGVSNPGRAFYIYDHADVSAESVGVLPGLTRTYVSTGTVDAMSDRALLGLIAHERGHVGERHMVFILGYVIALAMVSYFDSSRLIFGVGFMGYLALRRKMEFRADAAAVQLVGERPVVAILFRLRKMAPTTQAMRRFYWATAYPTFEQRITRVLMSTPRNASMANMTAK